MNKVIYTLIALLMMVGGMECSAQTVSGQVEGHDYVDLGLPSGIKWATYNVGATKPTEYGDYFAWGETKPKKDYSWKTYKWCKGISNTMTKYGIDSKYGVVDSLMVLDDVDDAATANWGSAWRMPTTEEQQELFDACTWKWVENFNGNEMNGHLGTSKANGATIFLPDGGDLNNSDVYNVRAYCSYWSSSLFESSSNYAYYLIFIRGGITKHYIKRYYGQSVRAVTR